MREREGGSRRPGLTDGQMYILIGSVLTQSAEPDDKIVQLTSDAREGSCDVKVKYDVLRLERG